MKADLILSKQFYKEDGLWYINLPEFLEAGLGTKNNLLMVDGSDKVLDILSRNTGEVVVQFCEPYSYPPNQQPQYEGIMDQAISGLNQEALDKANHAPVGYGMYYATRLYIDGKRHELSAWLCPVAEWVFGGRYPKTIWLNVVSYGPQQEKAAEEKTAKKSILKYLGL